MSRMGSPIGEISAGVSECRTGSSQSASLLICLRAHKKEERHSHSVSLEETKPCYSTSLVICTRARAHPQGKKAYPGRRTRSKHDLHRHMICRALDAIASRSFIKVLRSEIFVTAIFQRSELAIIAQCISFNESFERLELTVNSYRPFTGSSIATSNGTCSVPR